MDQFFEAAWKAFSAYTQNKQKPQLPPLHWLEVQAFPISIQCLGLTFLLPMM